MPFSSLQGKAQVSSRMVRNSHMKIRCYLPEESGEEGVDGDIPSDPEETDEVQGEPAMLATENEELKQESVEEDLQQLRVMRSRASIFGMNKRFN